MSLPGAHSLSAAAQAARLARLDLEGRLIPLSSVKGGQVLHTGCGFGPEFWLLPEDADPDRIGFDSLDTAPHGAWLICDGAEPVTDPGMIRTRGSTITTRIPQV